MGLPPKRRRTSSSLERARGPLAWTSNTGGCSRCRCFSRSGWIAAASTSSTAAESRALPLSYFRGLNFLLNEQPDKAIESFIEVVKVDPQTIELHFALGILFRRQGETERAIRMHQNLLDRPDLPSDKQKMARCSSSRRTISTRRAARPRRGPVSPSSTARRSSKRRSHPARDLRAEKDWPKAIAAMQRMEVVTRAAVPEGDRELPLRARERRDAEVRPGDRAAELERRAARIAACARANLLLGDLAVAARRLARRRSRLAADRDAESRISGAGRGAVSGAYGGWAARLPTGIRLLRNLQSQYPSLDLLNVRVSR